MNLKNRNSKPNSDVALLETGVSNARNVVHYMFSKGSSRCLERLLLERRKNKDECRVIFLVDEYFKNSVDVDLDLPMQDGDRLEFISTEVEPTTESIDSLHQCIRQDNKGQIAAVVGIGGGITLDTTKAISNLIGNGGKAEDYQGWDLLSFPGAYKIGIPTISGTGAEATRTCVMTNLASGVKLGMNSDYTVFDQLLLDPILTRTVPRSQYFYTGMDAYIHCVESINGRYRNPIGDAFSEQCIRICRRVFKDQEMMSDKNRSELMVASYLGGCAIGASYVGIVHPFSAGLSTILGLHHCIANCIALKALGDFYEEANREFMEMLLFQGIELPKGVCADLSEQQFDRLYAATIVHEKPLVNALGEGYKSVLTRDKVVEIFSRM